MKTSERISVVLSVIALAVSVALSGITIYYQFFYVNRSLIVATDDLVVKDGQYYAEVVFSNTGNQLFSVSNMHFCAFRPELKSFERNWAYIPTEIDGRQSDIVLSEVLISIKAGEIRVLRLRSRLDLTKGYPIIGAEMMNIGICFIVYDSEAKKMDNGLMPFTVRIDSNGRVFSAHRSDAYVAEHQKELTF